MSRRAMWMNAAYRMSRQMICADTPNVISLQDLLDGPTLYEWSYALRMAGWPDDRPVWTGSCPCQPFSSAGKGGGFDDERHLWPYWHHLIRVCRPSNVFGEQVASKDGLGWLDLVQPDLEGEGYAFGAQDRCSAGFGAPHIRQRLYFTGATGISDTLQHRLQGCQSTGPAGWGRRPSDTHPALLRGLDDHDYEGLQGHARHGDGVRGRAGSFGPVASTGLLGGLDFGNSVGRDGWQSTEEGLLDHRHDARWPQGQHGPIRPDQVGLPSGHGGGFRGLLRPGPVNGPWADADWLFCRDGKWRPVESGTFPLAHGATSRVGRLRAYGNAIDAENARDFIDTYLEAEASGFAPLVGGRSLSPEIMGLLA